MVKVTGSKIMVWCKVWSQGIYMWIMKAIILTVKKLWPRLKFLKSMSNFKVKVIRQKKIWYVVKCLVTTNTHVKYESPVSNGPMFKFLKSRSNFKVKVTRQKHYSMLWNGLSQGIHMWNMKALSLTVYKLWPRLKFLKSMSNFKVNVTRSNIPEHRKRCIFTPVMNILKGYFCIILF